MKKEIPISRFNDDESYEIVLPTKRFEARIIQLKAFATTLIMIKDMIKINVSARGWGYTLENEGIITKAKINRVENLINECRKEGYLPLDFTPDDPSRAFVGVGLPNEQDPKKFIEEGLDYVYKIPNYYEPDFWKGKDYYIQILVEKGDLVSVFKTICKKYRIPISSGKGWADINQRGNYIRNFKIIEEEGKIPVLLYVGDFDPVGHQMSNQIEKNFKDLKKATGWDCKNLKIDRIGLNENFIKKHKLAWIENLITGSGMELAKVVDGKIVAGTNNSKGKPDSKGKPHPDFNKPHVQKYLKKYGVKKVEANAILKNRETIESGREILRNTIKNYLGDDVFEDYEIEKEKTQEILKDIMEEKRIFKVIEKLKEKL